MFKKLFKLIAAFLNFDEKPKRYIYQLKSFESRSNATVAATSPHLAALVGSGKGYKWLIMQCPCGCKQELALNLMRSQNPFWTVKIEGANEFSVHPSVDSTTCGAHFWIKNSEVIWCD